jgi:hypothetical protein
MSFQFPNSPTNGQTYTPVGGYQYVWDGTAWRVLETPQLFATAQARNRIVNGAMQISQENGNAVGSANGYYCADQWTIVLGTTGTLNFNRVQVMTPNGSKDRHRIAVITADTSLAAGEVLLVQQNIEGSRVADFKWGTAAARQVILRFGFKAPAGTYAVCLQNGATNRTYLANFTITAGQANTDTEQVLVIPGDTTGTWPTDTSMGMQLRFTYAAGTSFNGAVGWQAGGPVSTAAVSNGLGVAGNIFELYDVGLYLDPDNTGLPPKWQMPDEAEELRACQRYFEVTGGGGTYFSGQVTSGSAYIAGQRWRVEKRAAPSLAAVQGSSGAAFPATAGALSVLGTDGYTESRTASSTAATSFFRSTITGSARM